LVSHIPIGASTTQLLGMPSRGVEVLKFSSRLVYYRYVSLFFLCRSI
jgi:hypothetical protein